MTHRLLRERAPPHWGGREAVVFQSDCGSTHVGVGFVPSEILLNGERSQSVPVPHRVAGPPPESFPPHPPRESFFRGPGVPVSSSGMAAAPRRIRPPI